MFFKDPIPENLFSESEFWKIVATPILMVLILEAISISFYHNQVISKFLLYGDGITQKGLLTITIHLSIALSFCYFMSISHLHNFHQCHIRHLKLIERYGDAYLKILKTELENTTLLGHLREQWETFEKIMKEQEKLNPNIVIKRHD